MSRVPDVKFCGLTRGEDAEQVGPLGGAFAGVIFAGGPRRLTPERGAAVLSRVASPVRRAAVFGDETLDQIEAAAASAALQVIQLHHAATAQLVARLRERTGCEVWAAVRVNDAGEARRRIRELDGVANAILLDSFVPGRLGGTGVRFDWNAFTRDMRPRTSRLVVAGGLTPENVGEAIRALSPDIVDVSSGVERTTGVKDHDKMRAFRDAVRATNGMLR